ncbi:MAG: DUF368 domain-containing protein [Methanobrevibacter sp.]|uniref:DUF368 domain-containing protein n=1 Tax=Methanobrevibacter sp. TaxID=66852 RepID=UPI0026DFA4E3|nr:DUF368 domain-containing protein [Methanobrevibacter sp.]MDO5849343.1 DUF368 domain-containing protein [Methanobrevibacter sp.]
MGSADIVPGVSGGTIALITGIYEHLVHAISKIRFRCLKPLLKGNFNEFKLKFEEDIDYRFFIPLLLGIGIAMLSLAKVITYCMDVYTAVTYSFFLGLILASSYVLYRQIAKVSLKHIFFTVIGLVLAYIFVSLNPIAANHSLPVLFVSGLIAICAMILPGISGSFLLLLLGQYEHMLNAIETFNIVEIVVFIVGAVIGILGFSRLLNYLLENYKEMTMAFLIGVMIGTLKIPAVNIVQSASTGIFDIVTCIVAAVAGLVIIIVMETRFDYIE